jgi:hypothetical protein
VSPKAKDAAKSAADDDASLKRLPGTGWQTRDGRFTIETASGTWSVTDAEQTDDLGLPLVRGPFRSLTDAKAAVAAARGTAAPESPLADRIKKGGGSPSKKTAIARSTKPETPEPPAPPPEARWIAALAARDRGRARRLIEQLEEAGVRDAEGVVRQDLTGGVPTVARVALSDRLAALLPSGTDARAFERAIGRVVEELDDGRDEGLGVRWRLVDGDGRPVGLTGEDLRAAARRVAERKESGR